MLVQRHVGLEHEVVKWLVLIAFIALLVLATARPASGNSLPPMSLTGATAPSAVEPAIEPYCGPTLMARVPDVRHPNASAYSNRGLQNPRSAELLELLTVPNCEATSPAALSVFESRSRLGLLESRLDAAHAAGLVMARQYRELGAAYAADGQHAAAARAFMKAMRRTTSIAGPAVEAMRNFRKAVSLR